MTSNTCYFLSVHYSLYRLLRGLRGAVRIAYSYKLAILPCSQRSNFLFLWLIFLHSINDVISPQLSFPSRLPITLSPAQTVQDLALQVAGNISTFSGACLLLY